MAEPLADGGEAHASVEELRAWIGFSVTGEIRKAARRTVEAFARRGADVSFLTNQYAIQRSECAATLIGTVKPKHLDSAVAAAETHIDEAATRRGSGGRRRRATVAGRAGRQRLPNRNR